MNPEQIADLRAKKYNATVIRLLKVHSDLMILRVRLDRAPPPHKPGQYNVLGLGYWEPRLPGCQEEHLMADDETRLARRSYSLSCSLLDRRGKLIDMERCDWLEYYISLVRQTSNPDKSPSLTPRLFMLHEGDRLAAGEKITGTYTLDSVRPEDTVVFLSTGTGEAPHNYMLWELLRRNHQGRILSVCCVRYARDLAYRAIHDELMAHHLNYTYLPLTTREDPATSKVYVQDLVLSGQLEERLGHKLDPEGTQFFLCGNPLMIGVPEKDRETGQRTYPATRGMIEILEGRGFVCDQPHLKIKGNIHFEEYW